MTTTEHTYEAEAERVDWSSDWYVNVDGFSYMADGDLTREEAEADAIAQAKAIGR